jgi:predicted RND superfamily exporter protein
VKPRKPGVNHTLLAFLLFALLGALAGFLRYGGELQLPGSELVPQDILAKVMVFAWAGILGLHLIIVFRAMSDNMFQGLLCLLVPGWSIVYLLFVSDNFYLRAVVFGCLIGIGQDGGIQIYDRAAAVMGSMSEFINSGGGDIRRAPPG